MERLKEKQRRKEPVTEGPTRRKASFACLTDQYSEKKKIRNRAELRKREREKKKIDSMNIFYHRYNFFANQPHFDK